MVALKKKGGCERIEMTDPRTGVRVVQLTSYPTPSQNLSYRLPCVTLDNRTVAFLAQRWGARDAPWDVWRCDVDGLDLRQLTMRGEGPEPWHPVAAALSPEDDAVYVVWPGTNVLYRVDFASGDLAEFGDFSPFVTERTKVYAIFFGRDAIYLATNGARDPCNAVRVDLRSGAATGLSLGGRLFSLDLARERFVIHRREPGTAPELLTVDGSGGDARFLCPWKFAHATMLGRTARVQGCGLPPDRCLWIGEEGKDLEKRAEGPYFWHSGASSDGEWIVADTNWPDEGLKLVHAPSGRWRTLCHAGATQEYTQDGHPHPSLSADGRIAVFGSNRTGVRQIYVAHITDEFRASVIAGELDRPRSTWL